MSKFLLKYKDMFIDSNSWAVVEAKRILDKIGGKIPKKGFVLFETGYGPSGLPHIGTFGEVVRTSFVKLAFSQLAPQIPTKLLVVSDDIDGFRKVPENLPNQDDLKKYIGFPLSSVPDPFAEQASFGDYMNKKLIDFLDNFGFEYEFLSATKAYKNGIYNEYLIKAAEQYQVLMGIMLPTLGEERRLTYSPFMPIDPDSGKVIDKGVIKVDPKTYLIHYLDDNGNEKTVDFRNGGCKLQWKCDFGMRWAALDVDYEIYGKDHFPNEQVYKSICSALGKEPPINYFYELFLDEKGQKISKSKGNGVTVEDWLRYAPIESLSYYMFLKPRTAKRLYFDVIPKAVDEYNMLLQKFTTQTLEQQIENPVFFVGRGEPEKNTEISFSLLLNLAATCNPQDEQIMWGFIQKYNPELKIGQNKLLDELVQKSVAYYDNFVKPFKKYKIPDEIEKSWLNLLANEFEKTSDITAANLQNITYEVGKTTELDDKEWFKLLYQVLLGLEVGPRFGTFAALYGVENMIVLIKKSIF